MGYDPLDASAIESALTTQVFGRELAVLPRTGSTNDVAKGLAAHGAPEGTVVVADEQTAGRGRLARRWLATPRTSLLCSLLFRPDLPPAQAQRLTMLCALAAADAIEQVAGLYVHLKWPNDLVVKSQIANRKPATPNLQPPTSNFQLPTSDFQPPVWKKLAGILTETGVTGEHLDFAVVGIGVNVNVGPEALPTLAPDATSILAEVGCPVDRVALLVALLAGVERRYQALRAGESPHREWAARLATLGQPVEVSTPAGMLAGVAESVDEDGALLLRLPDGGLRRLLAGDVTLALPDKANRR
jgi:BirA family biotin operon repressor/biotin-[acetyl-CoA-carboxylase] ligase